MEAGSREGSTSPIRPDTAVPLRPNVVHRRQRNCTPSGDVVVDGADPEPLIVTDTLMRTGTESPPHLQSLPTRRPARGAFRPSLCALIGATAIVATGCGTVPRPAPMPKPHPLGESYGQLYDPAKYEACRQKTPGDSRCRKFILKRNENPELWPYPDVPPMKWPDPPKGSVYRPGMTGVEYWRALCKAEAGEFIYKTVENVDGIYQIRPRRHETDYALMDPYVVEDPYGHTIGEEEEDIVFTYVAPREKWLPDRPRYSYFETAPIKDTAEFPYNRFHESFFVAAPTGSRFQRYFGFDEKSFHSMHMSWTATLKSEIGVVWRGIRREMDRELGVAGGELAVVELKSNELLALRRGFIVSPKRSDGGIAWTSGAACPEYSSMDGPGRRFGANKRDDFSMWFLTKVAKPSGQEYRE